MFLDKLLEGWEGVSNKYWSPEEKYFYFNDDKLWGNNDPVKSLREALKQAVCFDVDNVFDIYSPKVIEEKVVASDLPNIKMPYPIMWFESKAYDRKYQKEVIDQVGFCHDKISTLWIENKTGDNEYTVTVFGFTISKEFNGFGMTGWWAIKYDSIGKLLSEVEFPMMPGEKLDNEESFWRNILAWFLIIPLAAISFMHCKNVVIHSDEVSPKLQKSRERRGKLPLFTFKTLEIKPMVKILRDEGESETKGLKHALHICRGHFKDFSNGPGLGRRHAKGIYWWNSQVRGNREVGAVIKDYKVSPSVNSKVEEKYNAGTN